MSESSHDRIRDSDRIRCAEPVTVRLYGIKDISLPTYLLWSLATIIVVAVLIVACYEIMQPQTGIGERIRRELAHEDWALEAVSWTPVVLVVALFLETLEGAVVINLFRRRYQQLREDGHGGH